MFKKISVFVLIGIITGSIACKKADINFGSEFINTEATQVVKLDTFSVDVSTVLLDSFTSSNKGSLLLGGYTDPIFGRIDTKTFFEMAPADYTSEQFPVTSTFDSLTLILTLNQSYYGDTSKPINLYVHELTEKITPLDNGYYLFNNQQFATGKLLGSKTATILPTRRPADTICIRLSDELGKAFLAKLMNQSDKDLKTSSAFLEYFKGLRISSDQLSNVAFGCKDSIAMRLYYKSPDIYNAAKTFEFSISNKSHQFNHIAVDRTGTILSNLEKQKELHSSVTGNISYSQPISGAMIKLRFPNARNLLTLPQFTQILKAQLVVRPIKNSYNNLYPLPAYLRLASTTVFNQIGSDLIYPTSTGSAVTQLGNLTIDYLNGENTTYTYDLSAYIKALIADGSENKNGLLLLPPSPNFESQFNRVAIGNRNNTLNKIELQLYYVAVK